MVVPEPGFAFRDVDVHARFERVQPAAVSLYAGEHAVAVAPFVIGDGKCFVEQFALGQVEVVADPVNHLLLYFGRKFRAVLFLDRIAHFTYLENQVGQVRFERVAPPALEFGEHVFVPVGPFEFEAVGEGGPQVAAAHPAQLRVHPVGHPVQELFDGYAVEVVQYGAFGARSTEDYTHIAGQFDETIKHMVARRDVDRDGVASSQRIVTDSFGESVDLFGHQPQVEQLFLRVAVYRMYFGIDPPQDFIPVDRESFSAFEVDRLDGEHLQLLVAREELRSVRPTRPDDDIGYHTAFVAPFDRGLHHVEPRIAEPRQCRAAERIAARECDGVDLDAADARLIHQVEFAFDFGFGLASPVPPPPDIRPVFGLRVFKDFVQAGL